MSFSRKLIRAFRFINPISGFTLLELQVSMSLLMLTFSGLFLILMNYTKQLQWIEKRRNLYTVVVPGPEAKAIFTEHKTGLMEIKTVYEVTVQSLSEESGSLSTVAILRKK